MPRKLLSILVLLAYLLCSKLPANAQVGLFIRPDSSTLTSPVTGQTWLFDSTKNILSVFNGLAFQQVSQAQNNMTATTAPTTANDNTQGYSLGSFWYNTSSTNLYVCVSAATSSAAWVVVNNLGSTSIPLAYLQQGGATSGQSLMWNGSTYAPSNPSVGLSQLTQSGASTNQVPLWNGSIWAPGLPAGETVSSKTSSFSAAVRNLYLVDTSGGNVVCTLPDATTCSGLKVTATVKVSGHNLSFASTSSQLINNTTATSLTALTTVGKSYILESDGNGWWTVAGF